MFIIPNNNENNEFDFYKIIKSFFFANLLLSIYLYIVFLILSLDDKNNNKNRYYNNIYKKSINNLRNLDEKEINQTDENEYKLLKNEIIQNISYITYEGLWYNIDSLKSNGLLYFHFSVNREIFPDYLSVIIRLINGMYIDNWKVIYNEIPIKKLEIVNKTDKNIFILKGEFDSNVELGKIFEKKKSISYCKTIISLIFPLFENNSINYFYNIKGHLNSKCKFLEDYKIIINKKKNEK